MNNSDAAQERAAEQKRRDPDYFKKLGQKRIEKLREKGEPWGFALDKQKAREAGRLGGLASHKKSKQETLSDQSIERISKRFRGGKKA